MDTPLKCKICGGQLAPFDYVCDFCGTVIFEKVKTTDQNEQGTLNFEDGMAIIRENINTLHDIPKPTIGSAITAALRILIALYTFGIVLIFWRRPKKRFKKEIYLKLKNIIIRNISFLKISSKGSSDLLARIKVYEDELITVDKQVKKALISKNVALAIAIGIFVSWFIYIANLDPKSHANYTLTSIDSIARGNISNHITIESDAVVVTHTKPGEQGKWQLDIKLKIRHIEEINNKRIRYRVNLLLADKNGIVVEGFEPGELVESSKTTFKQQIATPGENISYYKFKFKNKFGMAEYSDTIPPYVTKFIIEADTLTASYQ